MNTSVDYYSDVHLEFDQKIILNKNKADLLILAGDIFVTEHFVSGDNLQNRYKEFLKNVSEEYALVLMIMGNHEHYHGDFSLTENIIRNELSTYGNIKLLNKEVIEYRDLRIFGATFWTDFNKADPLAIMQVPGMLNDYEYIKDKGKKLRSKNILLEHYDTINKLNDTYCDIVISHHAPSYLSIPEHFRGQFILNGAYASDLSNIILNKPEVKYWVHGHCHGPKLEYNVGDCKVVSATLGYPTEKFRKHFTPGNFVL